MSGSMPSVDSPSDYAGEREIYLWNLLCSVVGEICAAGDITAQLQALTLEEDHAAFQEEEDNVIASDEDAESDSL